MTTKKIIAIVAAVVISVFLLVIVFVAGIVGFAFYSVGKSEAAVTAKNFLRNNQRLQQDIGDVKDFGRFVTGSINVHDSDGNATLNLKVIGERRTVNATVELMYRNAQAWRITGASYENEAGDTIDLLHAFESRRPIRLLAAWYEC
jgi:cytochrome oxidase complex assembly protein 1